MKIGPMRLHLAELGTDISGVGDVRLETGGPGRGDMMIRGLSIESLRELAPMLFDDDVVEIQITRVKTEGQPS